MRAQPLRAVAPSHRSSRLICRGGGLRPILTGDRKTDTRCLTLGAGSCSLPMILVVALLIRATLGLPYFAAGRRAFEPALHALQVSQYRIRTGTSAAADEEAQARRKWLLGWSRRAASALECAAGDCLGGPRPMMWNTCSSTRAQARRQVRPGITGWAQVKGRNALSWDEKFDLDVWYVDHVSLPVDLRILGLTLLRVMRPHGISQPGSATMPKFTGSASDE